jgi:hypothetical protein
MRSSGLALILLLLSGLEAFAQGAATGIPAAAVSASACAAMPPPPVLQTVLTLPITETTRARILALLAEGSLTKAIEAWEVHTGRTAPQSVWALSTAFSKANQVAGRCIDVAHSIHDGFRLLGLRPQYLRFSPPPSSKLQVLAWEMQAGVEKSTIQISNNSRHFAVQVGERIYDAFTGPSGMALSDYLRRLHTLEGHPVMQVVVKADIN